MKMRPSVKRISRSRTAPSGDRTSRPDGVEGDAASGRVARAVLDLRRAATFLRRAVAYGFVPAVRRLIGRPEDVETTAVRLRRFIEEMGVTFVKLGQYLAIRLDLLPAEVCRELNNLFAEVEPVPATGVRAQVERELGKPLEAVFASFEPEPVGAASVAQVHRAVTHEGETLAVKVQRPGIEAVLRADIRNLRRLARVADRFRLLGRISAVELVDELAEFTLREVDFRVEGRTAERVGADSPPFVHVPAIRWDLTTRRVLTMEFVDGPTLLDVCALADRGRRDAFELLTPGVPPSAIVDDLAEACLTQFFVTGYFHGDPHPANILVRADGVIVFVDFGIFGELDAEQREILGDYIENLSLGNADAAFRCYLRLVEPSEETDLTAYRRETIAVLRRWFRASQDPSAEVAEKMTARYQGEMLEVMRRHAVRMHPNQLLFWRALAVLDATAHRLPIDFDLLAAIRRFFRRIRPHPLERLAVALEEAAAPASLLAARVAPLDAARVLDGLGRGDYRLKVRKHAAPRVRDGETAEARRLAFLLAGVAAAIVAAAQGGGAAVVASAIALLGAAAWSLR
jgi:ubiquinone biosynthesis protein